MKHISLIQLKSSIVILFIGSMIGCSHFPATASESAPPPPVDPPYTGLIQEARAEADLLRSELATIKIGAAKQQAELQSALKRVDTLSAREETMAATIQEMKNTLLAAESERDQLRQKNAELQAQSASIPDLQRLLTEVHTIQTSVQQMITNMKSLMADVIHIKQDMKREQKQAKRKTPSLTAFSMTTTSPSLSGKGKWTVSPGETLWGISQQHHISVKALMEMNQLNSDMIVEGQTLIVPTLDSRPSTEKLKNARGPQSASSSHPE